MSVVKEYNIYELRFLQILVSRELYQQIICFNVQIRIDRRILRGDSIMGHPDDKLEFVDRCKPQCFEKETAAGDYLDAIIHTTKILKKSMAEGWGINEGDLFGPESEIKDEGLKNAIKKHRLMREEFGIK